MFSLDEARRRLGSGASFIRIRHDGHATAVAKADPTPARALVQPVSDALKRVGDTGMVEGSVDRDQVWAAYEFVVSAEIVDGLDEDIATIDDFYESVEAMGYEWEISPSSSDP